MLKKIKIPVLLTILFSVVCIQKCNAADIWVEHWNFENVDIYVMDETIMGGSSNTGKYFKVSTKEVRNGKLIGVVNWSFSKYRNDTWRYRTDRMKNNTSVVSTNNKIFEFCMHKLDWDYKVLNGQWCE